MADLKRDWVRYCAGGGAALVLLFGWFMMTAEKPWREQERGLAPGKWVQVSIVGRRETHWVTYEYAAKGALQCRSNTAVTIPPSAVRWAW